MRDPLLTRRIFLKSLGYGAGACAACRSGFALDAVPPDASANRNRLAEILESTPRESIIEDMVQEIQQGLRHEDLFAALTQAAVHTLQPYPDVGFKFHGVMMLQSLHLATQTLTGAERWLPILWGIDEFKRSQLREENQTGWRMSAIHTVRIDTDRARKALLSAIDKWDRDAAEAAIIQLSRTTSPAYCMSLLIPYFARDYRALGHKSITGANAHRILGITGAHGGDAVLRSTVAAIVNHTGEANPASSDLPADSTWKQNLTLIREFKPDWHIGKTDMIAGNAMLDILRTASDLEASREATRLLAGGIGPQTLWEAMFAAAGEMMLRTGSFVALHANTMINALHYLYTQADNDMARSLLLLQGVALLTRFRSDIGPVRRDLRLDELEPVKTTDPNEIFSTMDQDRLMAARMTLGYLNAGGDSTALLKLMRHYTVYRAGDPHDYKYAEAVIENYQWMASSWRNQYLGSAMLSLNGPRQRINPVIRNVLELMTA
ncbi:MAG: Twin-arginine translocation signal protein [Gammaproteobacteria bacterium]|nr:Twin-arginine translocation signal protein [Gammaproteobacteria bacterium]